MICTRLKPAFGPICGVWKLRVWASDAAWHVNEMTTSFLAWKLSGRPYYHYNKSLYLKQRLNSIFLRTIAQYLSIIACHLQWPSSWPRMFGSFFGEENLSFPKRFSVSQLFNTVLELGLVIFISPQLTLLTFAATRQRSSLPIHIASVSFLLISMRPSCFVSRSPSLCKIFRQGVHPDTSISMLAE
jgi:hypothetical protein